MGGKKEQNLKQRISNILVWYVLPQLLITVQGIDSPHEVISLWIFFFKNSKKASHITCLLILIKIVYISIYIILSEPREEVLIRFDGWSSIYNYWCEIDATEIHPIGYCSHNGITLQKPNGTINSIILKSHSNSLISL